MNAIGIDVSKGKSKVAIIRPFGEVIAKPFDVIHQPDELSDLADYINSLEGESRVHRQVFRADCKLSSQRRNIRLHGQCKTCSRLRR